MYRSLGSLNSGNTNGDPMNISNPNGDALGMNAPALSIASANTNQKPTISPYISLLQGDAYNNLRETINNKGLNPWSAMALSRQNKLAQKNIEEATDRVAGQNATTMSKLAAGGGLTSGARERSAQSGQSDLLKVVQDINNKKDTNSLQIGISDGDFKQKAIGQLGDLEQADKSGLNAYNENLYNEGMRSWAAEKQAQATASSGKK